MATMQHHPADASYDDLLSATETSLIHGVPGVGRERDKWLGNWRRKQGDD